MGVDEGIIYQTITDMHKQARAKMIFAGSESEVLAELDKLIADTDKAGMDELLKYEEKRWNENKAKMNAQ